MSDEVKKISDDGGEDFREKVPLHLRPKASREKPYLVAQPMRSAFVGVDNDGDVGDDDVEQDFSAGKFTIKSYGNEQEKYFKDAAGMDLYFKSRVENRMFCRSFMRFMDEIENQVFSRVESWLAFYHTLFVLLLLLIGVGLVLSFVVERQRRKVMMINVRQIKSNTLLQSSSSMLT